MYRTKILNYLYQYYLKPILEFDGLVIDENDRESKIKKIDADENGKPSYLSNLNGDKMLSFVKDQESFYAWKLNKDNLEFFNPFIKYKQALLLLLMSTPMLYVRYCKDCESDADLADAIAEEVVDIPQSEILKRVDIQQLTTKNDDGEFIFSYSITLNADNGDNWKCVSQSTTKIVAIIMLMLYIIEYIDIAPEIYMKCGENWDNVEKDLIETLERYLKERKLNKRDMVKDQQLIEENNDINFAQTDIRDIELLDTNEFLNSGTNEEISDEEKVKNDKDDIKNTAAYKSVFVNSDQLMDDDWQHLKFI